MIIHFITGKNLEMGIKQAKELATRMTEKPEGAAKWQIYSDEEGNPICLINIDHVTHIERDINNK